MRTIFSRWHIIIHRCRWEGIVWLSSRFTDRAGFRADSRCRSKNAVLPMMAASVLNRGITVLENVPRIQDVFCMMGILDSGMPCALHGNRLENRYLKMNGWRIEQKAMGKMRSSVCFWERSWDAFARRASLQPRRMYDRKTSNRLAFAGTPCAGRKNTGNRSRMASCMHRQRDFAGQRLFFRSRVSARWKMPCLPLWQRWGVTVLRGCARNQRVDSCAIS